MPPLTPLVPYETEASRGEQRQMGLHTEARPRTEENCLKTYIEPSLLLEDYSAANDVT